MVCTVSVLVCLYVIVHVCACMLVQMCVRTLLYDHGYGHMGVHIIRVGGWMGACAYWVR